MTLAPRTWAEIGLLISILVLSGLLWASRVQMDSKKLEIERCNDKIENLSESLTRITDLVEQQNGAIKLVSAEAERRKHESQTAWLSVKKQQEQVIARERVISEIKMTGDECADIKALLGAHKNGRQ